MCLSSDTGFDCGRTAVYPLTLNLTVEGLGLSSDVGIICGRTVVYPLTVNLTLVGQVFIL